MQSISQPKINNRQTMSVLSLSLDKDDLRRFCEILQERANSAAEIEVTLFQQNQQSDEEFRANLQILKDSFILNITITGNDGEELWGSIKEVFESPNFPEQVKSLYVDSEAKLRNVYNYYPHNSFKIFLDFHKPKIFDLSFLPSRGTPNESNVEVKGYDATWVNGVFSEIKKFIDNRSSKISFVHNHSIYDILLWLFGFPLSFWICYKLSDQIQTIFGSSNVFVISALYFYVFVVTLFMFRMLFHYLRWICPLVEYRSKGNWMLAHRAFFLTLITGSLGKLIYDFIKWFIQ